MAGERGSNQSDGVMGCSKESEKEITHDRWLKSVNFKLRRLPTAIRKITSS
jgi:hypothetical protein